jgi:branched-chain amino acid transport system permease protein
VCKKRGELPLQLWVSVITAGCFFALIALGLLIVLEGSAVFNFALGPYAAFSALGSSWLVTRYGVPLGLAIVIGVASAVVFSLLTELLVVRPIERRTIGDEMPAIVAIVASMFAIQQFAGWIFGRSPLPGQYWTTLRPFFVGKAVVDPQVVLLAGSTLAIFAFVAVWLRVSRYGRMFRAVGDNQPAARLLGLPVNRIRLATCALAGAVVGLAGPLFSPQAGVSFSSGLTFALFGFIALVIGGRGSVWAPLVGGMLLAALQVWSSYWFGTAWLQYATFFVALAFFALRPEGIFARRVRV